MQIDWLIRIISNSDLFCFVFVPKKNFQLPQQCSLLSFNFLLLPKQCLIFSLCYFVLLHFFPVEPSAWLKHQVLATDKSSQLLQAFLKMAAENVWRPRFSGLIVTRIHPRASDELVHDVLIRKVSSFTYTLLWNWESDLGTKRLKDSSANYCLLVAPSIHHYFSRSWWLLSLLLDLSCVSGFWMQQCLLVRTNILLSHLITAIIIKI